MNRFLLRILLFFGIVLAIDTCVGWVMEYSSARAKDPNYHCFNEADEDILILGSSFAKRNFVPSVFQSETGMSCYNAGEAGNGIICAWARYNMFMKQHKPRLVIYTLTPIYDYLDTDSYDKYLSNIKPYIFKDSTVDELFKVFGTTFDKYKLRSNLVKYNSIIVSELPKGLMASNAAQDALKGYGPLNAQFNPSRIAKKKQALSENQIDSLKYSYLDRLFATIKHDDIPCIVILTPHYSLSTEERKEFELGINLSHKYGFDVIDDLNLEAFSGKPEYFYDVKHLNDTGARKYSKIVASRLNTLISKFH